jgi:predicted nucleic acid-binding protein
LILVDTSALYAVADEGELHHREAVAIAEGLSVRGEALLVHSYVIVESLALFQARSGHESSMKLLKDLERFQVDWVTEETHREALTLFSRLKSRTVSLVDCVSFTVMRKRGLTTAFAFDKHFVQQGFRLAGGAS